MKLDMHKACDRVECGFLEKMMLGFTYDATKTKVFESNLEGTVQFTFTLTNGKSVLIYSGNYDTLTEQTELATYREGDI